MSASRMACASARALISPAIPVGWLRRAGGRRAATARARRCRGVTCPAVRACLSVAASRRSRPVPSSGSGSPPSGSSRDASAADEQEPVQQPVGELDGGDVVAQLGGGDVPDDGDVRVWWRGPARCGSAARAGDRPTRSAASARVSRSRGMAFSTRRELGFDDQQPLVAGAGILAGGVADRPDQPLAVI